jgi:hypothetical protein
MGIYAEFKYGSAKSARENLQLPQLQLLGLSLVDLQSQLELDRHKLSLGHRDRTRLNNLLASDVGRNDLAIRSATHVLRCSTSRPPRPPPTQLQTLKHTAHSRRRCRLGCLPLLRLRRHCCCILPRRAHSRSASK